MSKSLPEYNSLVRWTVNDVCLWLMENGFPNFVRNFRESGVDGSRLADLTNQDLQRMRCPLNKQSELLRCVKAIERKEPSRPQGVQSIVNRPPQRQPEPPRRDYGPAPQPPANGYDSEEGSGPDDDYEWPSDFEDDQSDEDYENETANEVHKGDHTRHGHGGHHGHGQHGHQQSQNIPSIPPRVLPDRSQTNPVVDMGEQSGLIEEDVYDAPFEENEPQPITRTPHRSETIIDKLKNALEERSKKETVPEDSDSEGSYEEPSAPQRQGQTAGHRPPPPIPSQQKSTPIPQQQRPQIHRRVPPPPQEEEQPVYEDPDEEEKQKETRPRPTPAPHPAARRPPVETPVVLETQDVYEDPDNPPQLPPPVNKTTNKSPQVPRRQPPPVPVQTQSSVPGHRAPPPPPGGSKAHKKPPDVQLEQQDVYEIPDEAAPRSPDQPDYLDMSKSDKMVEEQDVYEVPDSNEEEVSKPKPKPKVIGGVPLLPGMTPSVLKKGQLKASDNHKHGKEKKEKIDEKHHQKSVRHQPLPATPSTPEDKFPGKSLPKVPQEEPPAAPPPHKTQNKPAEKHPPVPRPPRKDAPGKKDNPSRPLPTPPQEDDSENMSSFPWYHPTIDRNEADRRLKDHGTNCVFLIRNSSKANQPYTLALLYENKVYNLPIRKRDDNKFAMGSFKRNEQAFEKVSKLVEFFNIHTLILGGTTTAVRLKTPLPK